MGCSSSTVQEIPREWYEQFTALKLSNAEIKKLHNVYRRIDSDRSGVIEIGELFRFLQLERTPFTERVFTIFDMNGTGKVDFREFTMSLWNYCTLANANLGINI